MTFQLLDYLACEFHHLPIGRDWCASLNSRWRGQLTRLWYLAAPLQIVIVAAKSVPDVDHSPSFITTGKRWRVPTADTIVLPCEVSNLGKFVLAWKRGNAILTAGSTRVSPDERIRLVEGYNLEIREVQTNDAGDYICHLATLIPKEITHTLEVLVPPRIQRIKSGESVEVRKGEPVTLDCSASGNPTPNITWTRKNDVLPQGEKYFSGSSYPIKQTTRHDSGVYICTANNGVQPPASEQINLKVNYAPEIQVEKNWVHSGENAEAELVCIVNAEPAAEDIEEFVNGAKYGVIYFCLGSLLQARTMPVEKRNAFLKAFSQIPQRVLWKYEEDDLPGKTDNIMIRKWMPQRDILAHPKVRLFIAHGGALGLNEAVYEGIPILGIPFWVDQTLNIKSVRAAGVAEMLEYPMISTEEVLSKIQKILNDDKYKKNAERLKAIYRDRPLSAMDTAVYWTEYVIRHKGAIHLKTAAVRLHWCQYLLLDTIAFLILVSLAVVIFFIISCVTFAKFIHSCYRLLIQRCESNAMA